MKSGRVQAFFYTPRGNQYWVEPLAQAADAMETSIDDPLGLEAGRRVASVDPLDSGARGMTGAATLPDNVLFVSGGALLDQRDAAALTESDAMTPSSFGIGAGQGGAADPILFYPDGTSATARIVLGNSRNHFVIVELRGLTGIARSSDLLTAEELPP